jgi:hypothetical protein
MEQHDLISGFKKPAYDSGADETGAAYDKNPHANDSAIPDRDLRYQIPADA